MKLIFTISFLFFSIVALAQNLSNKGKEFWTGYGHNQFFTKIQGDGEKMVLYLSAEEPAVVTVSINGTAWTRTYNIPANTVIPTDIIPKTGADDARLTNEGLFNRGIHIVSDTPIVAYAHIYGQTSSGATMLLPVETYGYNYFSVNSEQDYDVDCFSWFFVVANDNDTRVRITPSQPTVGGKAKAQPFEVALQKGEIYNVMGKIRAGTAGYDMTGSKVESIIGADGKCHPVAMFSGSSRTMICSPDAFSGGGDNIIQQVFPSRAWGTIYLTAPTASTIASNVLNNNKYRVVVKDRTTIVKRNGVRLTGLVNNFYYEYLSSGADYITADKPVMVAQLMPSGTGCGTEGDGDPEMFYISSLAQAIKKVNFYNTDKEAIAVNYLNMIIPDGGLASLKIDGSNIVDYSYPHPQMPGYTVIVKKLPTAEMQHTAQSDSAFTAITYGMGFAESYGYNAGTLINNLDTKIEIKNTYAANNTDYTCPKTVFTPVLKTMYKPSSIFWELSKVKGLQPANDTTITGLTPSDSVIENGRKYYFYSLNGNYTFSDTGSYNIPIIVTDPTIENCSFTESLILPVLVKAGPTADFKFASSTCVSDSIQFTDISPNALETIKWWWTFGDNTIDSIANPIKHYLQPGSYNVNMAIVRDLDGCIADTSKIISVYDLPLATFDQKGTVCLPAGNASFINQSTASEGNQPPLKYEWQFGDGKTSTDKEPVHQYTSNGTFDVKLKAISAKGCVDTASKNIQVFQGPVAAFNLSTNTICQNTAIAFTNTSNTTNSNIIKWQWDFGDGTNATDTNATHIYNSDGKFTMKLIINSNQGCADTIVKSITVYKKPVAEFTTSTTAICQGKNIAFAGTNTATTKWDWSFGDGTKSSTNNPTHTYISTGQFAVQLKVASADGCTDSIAKTVQVNENPTAKFLISDTSVCEHVDIIFSSSSFPTSAGIAYWNWNFGDGSKGTTTSLLHPYISAGFYTVKLIIETTTGCTDSTFRTVEIVKGPTAIISMSDSAICQGETVAFTGKGQPDNTNITTWNWNLGEGTKSSNITTTKQYNQAGLYKINLTVTNNDGCNSLPVEKQLIVYAKPRVDAGPNMVTKINVPVTLQASSSGNPVSIKWTPATYLSNVNSLQPVATVPADQWYFLTVTGANSCTATDSVEVTIQHPLQFIPNAFSPNGDGINDTWTIPYMNEYPNMAYTIFDRWGLQIYASKQNGVKWDGKSKGKEMPIGVYYFIATDGIEKLNGSITLLR